MIITGTQCAHPDCNACAREFFRWRKTRESQMSSTHRGPSFAEAAATSIKAPRPAVGARVRVLGLPYDHTALVLMNSGSAGADGRHWVRVEVHTPAGSTWDVHVPVEDLKEIA